MGLPTGLANFSLKIRASPLKKWPVPWDWPLQQYTSGQSHGTGHFPRIKSGQSHGTGHFRNIKVASPIGLATSSK